jgi:HEAT repeats
MTDPESGDKPHATEELLFQIRTHYSRASSLEYNALPDANRVQKENEIFLLEKEIFRRESATGFLSIQNLCASPVVGDRMAALMVLYRGEHPSADLATLLLPRLEVEKDPEILQQLILWFRYQRKDDRAVPSICKLRNHPDYMVRTCVADALGAYRSNNEAIAALSALLRDAHVNVRNAAKDELDPQQVAPPKTVRRRR